MSSILVVEFSVELGIQIKYTRNSKPISKEYFNILCVFN